MNRPRLTMAVLVVHVWAVLLFLGGILCMTTVLYPNVFHDIPASLALTMDFATVSRPTDFFTPVGFTAALSGLVFLMLGWRIKAARYLVLASVVLLVGGEIVFSMAYFWPRNRILFVEGAAVHPVAYLNQVAQEFRAGHWLRIALCAAAAVAAFNGLLGYYRNPLPRR